MISRRDALKLGAAGLVAPSVGLTAGTVVPAVAQEAGGSVPMFRGNAARTGEMPGPVPSLDYPIVVKWRFTTDYGIATSPSVDNGTLYFGSGDGNVYALNVLTGIEEWRFSTSSGVNSSPAVVDGLVYFGSRDGNIYAVDSASGEEEWRFSTGEEVNSSPAVSDNTVFITSWNGDLHALDAKSGEEIWRRSNFGGDRVPTVAEGMVYMSGGNLLALDATTGEEVWEFWIPGNNPNDVPVYISFSPPAVANGTVFVCSGDVYSAENGNLHAVDASTGDEKWRYTTSIGGGAQSSSPSVVDNIVYVSGLDDWEFHALDARTGEALWSTEHGSTPSVSDNMIFLRSGTSSHLHAIDAASGEGVWKFRIGIGGSPVIIDSMVLISELGKSGDSIVGTLYALGNLLPPVLMDNVTLRGAPSKTGIERGSAKSGTEIQNMGSQEQRSDGAWVEVTIDGANGWIPLEAIDPATLPPDGEIEYVYIPE